MPKLKLQNRRLCVSNRKLVCGCSGTPGDNDPCCLAARPCKIVNQTNSCRLKVWFSYAHSGKLVASSGGTPTCGSDISLNASGAGLSSVIFPPQVTTSGCTLISEAFVQHTAFSTSAMPGSVTPSSTMNATAGANQISLNGASDSVNKWICQFGFGASLTSATDSSFRDNAGGFINTSWQAGALTATVQDPWTGTATPSLIRQGNCVVGIKVDFSAARTYQCRTGSPATTVNYQATYQGSIAVAMCGCLLGCGSSADICGSDLIPGSDDTTPAACASMIYQGTNLSYPPFPIPPAPGPVALPIVEPTDDPIDGGGVLLP